MRRFFWLCFIVVLSAACSEDGENPYALWQRYSHPDGLFSFYYMAPPFNVAPHSTDAHPIVVVDAYNSPTDGGLDARIRVEAWVGLQEASLERDERISHWIENGYLLRRRVGFVNYVGHEGISIELERDEHWVKEIFYPQGDGSVAISVWTDERGSRADIYLLLDGFRPGYADE